MPSYTYPKLELKYCERCGGLWLRPQGTETVYCVACAEQIRQLPPPFRGGTPGALEAACCSLVVLFAALLKVADPMAGAFA